MLGGGFAANMPNMMTCQACGRAFDLAPGARASCPFCTAPVSHSYVHTIIDGIDVDLVAIRQRRLIWCVMIMLLLTCLNPAILALRLPQGGIVIDVLDIVIPLAVLALAVLAVVWVVATMSALRIHLAWRIILVPLLLVPLVGLLCLLLVNRRATKVLQLAGLHVGFMGVREEDVIRKFSQFLCTTCGYDLTGNVSGFCSECGTAIPPEKLRPVSPKGHVPHAGVLSDGEFRRACRMAGWQRLLPWCVLVWAGCFMPFVMMDEEFEQASGLVEAAISIAAIALLGLPLIVYIFTVIPLPWHGVWKFVVAVVMLIPFVNVIVLLTLHGHIGGLLREMGFRVGFFGVSKRSLREQRMQYAPTEVELC